MTQLPLLLSAQPQHPRTENAPRNARVHGPEEDALREAAFSNIMDDALAPPGTDTEQSASLQKGTGQNGAGQNDPGQKGAAGKADGGGGALTAIPDFVTGLGAPLLVPAVLALTTGGQVPAAIPATGAGGPAGGDTVAAAAVAVLAATAIPAATATPVGAAAATLEGLVTAPMETGGVPGKAGAAAGKPGSVAAYDGTSQAAAANTPAATTPTSQAPIANAGAGAGNLPGTVAAVPTAETAQQPDARHQAPAVGAGARPAGVPEIRPAAPAGPTSGQQAQAAPNLSIDAGILHTGQQATPQIPVQTPPPTALDAFAAQQTGGATIPSLTQPGRLSPQLTGPLFTLATAAPGEHVMTLKVSPENLGPLTVRAHIDASGVRIELFAPGDAGRDALRTILPELRRGLADSGLGAQLNLSQHGAPLDPDPGVGNQAAGHNGDGGQRREGGQQSQPTLTGGALPDPIRPRPQPAVVLSAARAGALDVLA